MNDEERLEQLISTYQNLIYSICCRLINDPFDSEDLTQDTFLSAYKHLSSFDGANEKAWLCRIATNKCLDYLKRAGRRSIPTEDSYFLNVPVESHSPESSFLEQEIRSRLYDCCNSLSPPYKEVALDYFYHEIPIADMAKKSKKPIKTIQTQVYRAKAMLRKLYRKEDLS